MAHLQRWEDRGWYLTWHDRVAGAGRAGRRRVKVEGGDHADAIKAAGLPPDGRAALVRPSNREQRKKLLACYEALELARERDAARLAGSVPRFERPVAELVDAYCDLLDYRATLRDEQPGDPPAEAAELWKHGRRRKTLTPRTAKVTRDMLRGFVEALPRRLTCAALAPAHVARWLDNPAHAASTINRRRQALLGMFNALTTSARKAHFRADPREWFADEIEALPEQRREIVVATPAELVAFFDEALRQRDRPEQRVIARIKNGRREELVNRYAPPPPLVEAALLFALTGMRRGELLALTWDAIDLRTGLVTIRASKTGSTRYLPLEGDRAADVAPQFLELLRCWRALRPRDQFVLPDAPVDGSALTWRFIRAVDGAGLARGFGPQTMRRTFESALAAIGVPAGLAAFWTGHSVTVAERHYRAFIRERGDGLTVESVLGLLPIVEAELARCRALLRPRLVEGDGRA